MKKVDVFEVEQGVPIPKVSQRTSGIVPIGLLEVGDSIVFSAKLRPRVASYASQLKRRKGLEYTIRLIDPENCRVWRTK